MNTLQPAWWQPFLGIPAADGGRTRAGCDCWGLPVLVYAEVAGVTLPSYTGAYVSTEEAAEVAELIATGRDTGPWRLAEGAPRPLDVILFRRSGYTAHMGIVADPAAQRMLHMGPYRAELRRWDDPRWATRLVGFWRHEALA